jgi:uncharacterized protein YpbB
MSFAKNSPRRLRNCEKSQISVREKPSATAARFWKSSKDSAHPFTIPESPIPLTAPERETLALLQRGCDLGEIAVIRNVQIQTVQSLVLRLVKRGEHPFLEEWMPRHRYDQIQRTGAKVGWERLKPIKELLPEEISYGEIRLVAAHQRLQTVQQS